MSIAAGLVPSLTHAGGYYAAGSSGTFTTNLAGGSTTLADIKKNQRVTLDVTFSVATDSDNYTGDLEQIATGATVTVDGLQNPVTVNSSKQSARVQFVATKDQPTLTVSFQLSGTGPLDDDGDGGGIQVSWRGIDKDTGPAECGACVGDPINALTGNTFVHEVDYVGAGDFPLTFDRFYNSQLGFQVTAFGSGWSHSYNHSRDNAQFYRAEGPKYVFGPYGLDPDAPIVMGNYYGCPGGNAYQECWLNKSTNVFEVYSGKLVALYDLKGNSQTLAYDASGRLISITHSNGRSLQFTYNASNRIQTMTDPNGGIYTYSYDANNNLVSVQHPDGSTRKYLYGNSSFPNALTAIVDELGNTFTAWTYDANGYAITSNVGNGLIVESANSPDVNNDTHTVTNSGGTTRTLVATEILGRRVIASMNTTGSSGGSATSGAVYDASGNKIRQTNKNGSMDCFNYNGIEQVTSAFFNATMYGGSCAQGSNSYARYATWHPTLYVRTAVAEPSMLSYIVYHQRPDPTSGNAPANCITPAAGTSFDSYVNIVCKTAVFATTDSTGFSGVSASVIKAGVPAKTTAFTYDPNGHVLTAADSLGNVTTYAYYPDTTADHRAGDLQSITNALQQVTTFDKYDGNGRLLQTTDPSGLVQAITYDWRGNVLTRTIGALTITYTYDAAGQLQSVQQPDGTKTINAYDLAHRLQKVTDPAGNSTNYAYDTVGNISSVTLKDSAGNTVQSKQYVYDFMNNVVKSVGGAK